MLPHKFLFIKGKRNPVSVVSIGWTTDARIPSLLGAVGTVYTVVLPANGAAGSTWGTDIYTDDSRIGSAAVHKGLITFATGGSVNIQILPGQSGYLGSTRNGVTTSSYGSWPRSFAFV